MIKSNEDHSFFSISLVYLYRKEFVSKRIILNPLDLKTLYFFIHKKPIYTEQFALSDRLELERRLFLEASRRTFFRFGKHVDYFRLRGRRLMFYKMVEENVQLSPFSPEDRKPELASTIRTTCKSVSLHVSLNLSIEDKDYVSYL